MTLPPLILASGSRYRRELLTRLGIVFTVTSPNVDEAARAGEAPLERAQRLAQEKALNVATAHRAALVIGSDQVACTAQVVLDKPGTAETARTQLGRLSGSTAHFHTACAAVCLDRNYRAMHVDTTRVVFRTLQALEIERYVATERPFDCAGSFKAEALGISLLERIESSDPTALIGLPLIWVAGALRGMGYELP
ncbi:MAG TPA: Maf family protein [Steroidobacteraceae bacterium]|nr:Maf family protein [Steroidobacteraceae bacterium]